MKSKMLSSDWVRAMPIGSALWLVKERTFATIQKPYEKAFEEGENEVGKICLSVRRSSSTVEESWFVRPNGTGMDSKPLVQPCGRDLDDILEGKLPQTTQQDAIYAELAQLQERVKRLEGAMTIILNGA